MEPELVAVREGAKSVPRERESASSFVLSIPAPALLSQVDEHTMDLYVVTPDGTTIASRVHAAVLICVKTAAILGAVLSLGPLKEEDYMRLLKMALEPKDELVVRAGCQHAWPCTGKPAIVFHDRGKIFTSERARSVLVDRFQIITEQAPPYCPSANEYITQMHVFSNGDTHRSQTVYGQWHHIGGMSSLRKNAFALPSQGCPPVPSARATQNADRGEGQALVYNRKNGLGRGWRMKDERQEQIQPLHVIACNTPHNETVEPLLS
jgi:hypothetical protein